MLETSLDYFSKIDTIPTMLNSVLKRHNFTKKKFLHIQISNILYSIFILVCFVFVVFKAILNLDISLHIYIIFDRLYILQNLFKPSFVKNALPKIIYGFQDSFGYFYKIHNKCTCIKRVSFCLAEIHIFLNIGTGIQTHCTYPVLRIQNFF